MEERIITDNQNLIYYCANYFKNYPYKEDLYQPNILCGHSIGMPELPFIEKINYTRERIENISPQTSYQFANKIYTINNKIIISLKYD